MKNCPICNQQNQDIAKFCQICGQPFFTPGNINVTPAYPHKRISSGALATVLIVVGVFLALETFIIGLMFGNFGDKLKKPETEATSIAENQSEAPAEKASASVNDKNIVERVKPGYAITVDGIKISFVSCNKDFKGYSQYIPPANGNKVVRAEFIFENQKDIDISLYNFICYADNNKCEAYYSVDDYSGPALEALSPGRKLNCVVYYEVPKNAAQIELEYEPDFWSGKKVVFEFV